MVKERSCDRCGTIITRGEDYYKVCLLEHEEKLQKLNHAGDLCKNCWNLILSVGVKE